MYKLIFGLLLTLFVFLPFIGIPEASGQACTSDADCLDPAFPKCDIDTMMCRAVDISCQSDADCLDPNMPFCDDSTMMCVDEIVEESACDVYEGAAFGLCNAYCDAMDCDGPDPHASDKACSKVLENFMKKFEEPMVPCELANVCSQQVIDRCNAEGEMAVTEICNGRLVCSHVIGIRGCSRVGCAIPN